jgi:hypothetical protein
MPTFDRQSAIWIFLIFLIVALVVCLSLSKEKEGYGSLMGAMSRYKQHYIDALNECERGDHTLFQGELACSRWVNSQYNLLFSENKEPSPRDTSYTRSREFCGGNRQCIDDYFSQLEMNKLCAQRCQWKYGSDTADQCIEDCFKTLLPNISSMSSWTYD